MTAIASNGAAVVIGAGDATGGAVAAAFARDGLVAVPVRTIVDLGGRYSFKLAGNDAVLRVQSSNLFGQEGFDLRGAGAYGPLPGRVTQAYLTVDF